MALPTVETPSACNTQMKDLGGLKISEAQAHAFYACKYFQSVADTNFWRNVIAGVQAATQIYFADKQYDIAKKQQNRLDNISNTELDRSGKLFKQFEKGIACEDTQLAEACKIDVPKPDYAEIKRRVSATVIAQFTQARKKITECYPSHCMAAACNALEKLATEQARTISAVVEATWQKERALYEIRLATHQKWRYDVLAFGRGAIAPSNALMAGAASAAQAAGQINPYSGWIQAINGIAETAQRATLQESLQYRGMALGNNMGNTPSAIPNTGAPKLNSGNWNSSYSPFVNDSGSPGNPTVSGTDGLPQFQDGVETGQLTWEMYSNTRDPNFPAMQGMY